MRADDVPEYVQDGVVDCGITGLDIVEESGVDVVELLRLGFGACTLEAAVPTESTVRSLADLAGARVAQWLRRGEGGYGLALKRRKKVRA